MPDKNEEMSDRRRELRRTASGPVRLELKNPAPCELDAELMDLSTSGFRISHHHGLLALGTDVSFRHPEAAGRARVVWNWVLPDHVETGFVLVR